MKAKHARQIRAGVKYARADIRNWGDDEGSKLLALIIIATIEKKIFLYPALFQRGYRETINKFYKKGGNINGNMGSHTGHQN